MSVPWHTFRLPPKIGPRAFRYRRDQFKNGTLARTDEETVYCMSQADFDSLLSHWNRLGTSPSEIGELSYAYSAKL